MGTLSLGSSSPADTDVEGGPSRNRVLLAVGAITLLGAALRFATLDVQSFWFDEAFTVAEGPRGIAFQSALSSGRPPPSR